MWCYNLTLLLVIQLTSDPGGSDSTVSDSFASTGGDIIPITAGTDGGSSVGAIAGGVVGALLAVVVLLTVIIVMVLTIILKRKNNNQGMCYKISQMCTFRMLVVNTHNVHQLSRTTCTECAFPTAITIM